MDADTVRTKRAGCARRRAIGLFATILIGTSSVAMSAVAVESTASGGPASNGGGSRANEGRAQSLSDSIQDGPAKNVILLVGDGMGESQITLARNYLEGAGGTLAGIDSLPFLAMATTHSVDAGGAPVYATESAAGGSALSTGTKTLNGRVSADIENVPQATLIEIAKANGLKTGTITTAYLQDATPAASTAHVSSRRCIGPDETAVQCPDETVEAGGLGSITEQQLDLRPDIMLGGGAATYDQSTLGGSWAGSTLWEQAESRGYRLVTDAAGLAAVDVADQHRPLLGLFAAGDLPRRWTGPEVSVGGGDLAGASCVDNSDYLGAGTDLAAMTERALDLLDDDNGFFLQVEGASIDKAGHQADPCGQIGETAGFDEAVQQALAFAAADGDTLVIVTADHGHASQIVEDTPTTALSTRLLTPEGAELIVAYGNGVESEWGAFLQHDGTQVGVRSYGPGAADLSGLVDQTDVFFTIARHLGLDRELSGLSAGATISVSTGVVAPGERFDVTVDALHADWQTRATLASNPVDLGQLDVIDGTVVYSVVAPSSAGTHTVTVVGAQTGTELSAQIEVADPAAAGGSPSPDPTAIAANPADDASSGTLAITGGVLGVGVLLVGAALIAAGAAATRARRVAGAR